MGPRPRRSTPPAGRPPKPDDPSGCGCHYEWGNDRWALIVHPACTVHKS